MSGHDTHQLIQSLSAHEAQRVLSDISSLSHALERLVHESASAIVAMRSGHPSMPIGPSSDVAPMETRTGTGAVSASPAAPVGTAVIDTSPLGKDKATWAELTASERTAATLLGYTDEAWEEGDSPPTCNKLWRLLSAQEQQAALALGYTSASWDSEVEVDQLEDPPQAMAQAAAEPAPMPVPALSIATGATVPGAVPPFAVSATPAHPEAGGAGPGVVPNASSNCAHTESSTSGYRAKDGMWADLTAADRRAAGVIGYTAHSWDEGEVPDACTRRWAELDATLRQAALQLGYTQPEWDAELEDATMEVSDEAAAAHDAASGRPAVSATAGASVAHASSWSTISSARQPAAQPMPPAPPMQRMPAAPPTDSVAHFDSGMIFGCTKETHGENMSRQIFGLPASNFRDAQRVGERTALFLFNYNSRDMIGVFVRNGPAGMNLEPEAWANHRRPGSGATGSPYPAQIRWVSWRRCKPIPESRYRSVLTAKDGPNRSKPKYEYWLSATQAQQLAQLCMRYGA